MMEELKEGDRKPKRRWVRYFITVLAVVTAAGSVVFFVQNRRGQEQGGENIVLPVVAAQPFGKLAAGVTIEKVATIEPATSAPLIARMGGRVTQIKVQLGETVGANGVVAAIDSKGVANPARAQLASAKASLVAFRPIEAEALRSADLAVVTAQLSLETVEAGGTLSVEQAQKSREQADLAVRQAKLAFEDAVEAENRNDLVVRSADLALQAAGLAQDQATIARSINSQQTGDAMRQARQGLMVAEQSKARIAADLSSQRVAVEAQIAAASEQVRLAQVAAPITGQVTRLAVKVGDFVRQGEEIGEVVAFEGARIVIDVETGVREKLDIGQEVKIKSGEQEFMGSIVRLADAPRSDLALWQVEIFIAATPQVVHPGDLATVELPVGVKDSRAAFIPLDAVVVRQDGMVLFSVDGEGLVSEHKVSVVGFFSDYVEGVVDVPGEALVIVSGNRTLKNGDQVKVKNS